MAERGDITILTTSKQLVAATRKRDRRESGFV